MDKWPVGLLLLVALVQVQDVLSRSAGQAAALAPNAATVAEKALPGFQRVPSGSFSGVTSTAYYIMQRQESEKACYWFIHRTTLTQLSQMVVKVYTATLNSIICGIHLNSWDTQLPLHKSNCLYFINTYL